MSAKTKDERINEVADQLYELVERHFETQRVEGGPCPNLNAGVKCDCDYCKAHKLIEWIRAGWDDDDDQTVRRAMDPSDEELGLEGEELTADNLTPEGMGPDDKEE